jgi:hypothetical protein
MRLKPIAAMAPWIFSALAALSLYTAVPEARDSSFAVAVLRRDGVIVPFANYDGKSWRSTWPDPRQQVDVPIAVRDVPKRWWGSPGPVETWQAWIPGRNPVALHVQQPDIVPTHCMRQVALRTDYDLKEQPQAVEGPYPKDGLAVSAGSPPVEGISVATGGAADRAALQPVVVAAFNQQERTITEHPINTKEREATAPTLEAVYAYGADPRVYYVEAVRTYRRNNAAGSYCRAVAFGGGWFRRQGRSTKLVSSFRITVLDCDRNDSMYMLPLGVIRIAERTFWVAQFAGWNAEYYDVIEIKPAAVVTVLSRFGGWC